MKAKILTSILEKTVLFAAAIFEIIELTKTESDDKKIS